MRVFHSVSTAEGSILHTAYVAVSFYWHCRRHLARPEPPSYTVQASTLGTLAHPRCFHFCPPRCNVSQLKNEKKKRRIHAHPLSVFTPAPAPPHIYILYIYILTSPPCLSFCLSPLCSRSLALSPAMQTFLKRIPACRPTALERVQLVIRGGTESIPVDD